MAQDILIITTPVPASAPTDFTITLTGLANNAGRVATMVTTGGQQGAFIGLKLTAGATKPATGGYYAVYILRSDGVIVDDNASATNAAFTPYATQPAFTIPAPDAAGGAVFRIFSTNCLGPLGPYFTMAIVNKSGAALTTDGSLIEAAYRLWVYQLQ